MKKITYWDVLRTYHSQLYKSKMYWMSGILIFLGFVMMLVTLPRVTLGSTVFALGIILLFTSKIIVLNQQVKN